LADLVESALAKLVNSAAELLERDGVVFSPVQEQFANPSPRGVVDLHVVAITVEDPPPELPA
jgi:hypothetical protein